MRHNRLTTYNPEFTELVKRPGGKGLDIKYKGECIPVTSRQFAEDVLQKTPKARGCIPNELIIEKNSCRKSVNV